MWSCKGSGSTVMQTAQAIIRPEEGGRSVTCRVLFDSRSQRPFICRIVAEMFGVKSKEKEWLTVSGFGETVGREGHCNVYSVEVKLISGEKNQNEGDGSSSNF